MKTIFQTLKTIHRLSLKLESKSSADSRLRPIHRSSTDGIFMNRALGYG